MNKFVSALSKLLWDTDLIGTRFTLAMAEFFWALMLAWPGDTFGRPTYDHMSKVMSESQWALVFLASALVQTTLVLKHSFHCTFARYFALWNCLLWTFVVVSMLLSVYPPPAAIAGEIALSLASIWICVRPYILVEGYRRAGIL